jgi:hypothetical protein
VKVPVSDIVPSIAILVFALLCYKRQFQAKAWNQTGKHMHAHPRKHFCVFIHSPCNMHTFSCLGALLVVLCWVWVLVAFGVVVIHACVHMHVVLCIRSMVKPTIRR